MSTASAPTTGKKLPVFNLTRSFALLSLLCIALIGTVSVVVVYRYLAHHMLERDAIVTMEFVQGIADSEGDRIDFSREDLVNDKEGLGEFFTHVAEMPDVVRATIYSVDGTIVWSSDKSLIGQRFYDNANLKKALAGNVVFEHIKRRDGEKAEHTYLPDAITEFVETYIPIWNKSRTMIAGIAEVYRVPDVLLDGLRQGMWLLWTSTAVSGLLIYVSLFWIVRRASSILNAQHERLLDAETMGAVGTMAAALAHGIRNPLASIRSSAELALEEHVSDFHRELSNDIITEADRLEQWIRKLILLARPQVDTLESVQIGEVIRSTLEGFAQTMKEQGVALVLDLNEPLPSIRGNSLIMEQVFQNLVSNALDAMPQGGTLTVAARATSAGDQVELKVIDTGEGMTKDLMAQIFKPFVTSKRTGLGLGLSLVRRLVERLDGTITLSSREGDGTTAYLRLPKAAD